MRRRFVIGVDALDDEQEAKFRAFLDEKKGAWWHWIENLWLLTTKDPTITAAEIRDNISKLSPTARVLVFEFPEDITWAATGSKNSKGKKMTDWIKSPWGERDE